MIKEKFVSIVNAYKDDNDVLDIIQKDMKSIGDYFSSVYMMETSMSIIYARYEGQELRDRIEALDSNRRFCHERAIMGVKRLNRFADMKNLEPVFSGDTDDRLQIADFCRDTMVEFFDGRVGQELSINSVREYEHEMHSKSLDSSFELD